VSPSIKKSAGKDAVVSVATKFSVGKAAVKLTANTSNKVTQEVSFDNLAKGVSVNVESEQEAGSCKTTATLDFAQEHFTLRSKVNLYKSYNITTSAVVAFGGVTAGVRANVNAESKKLEGVKLSAQYGVGALTFTGSMLLLCCSFLTQTARTALRMLRFVVCTSIPMPPRSPSNTATAMGHSPLVSSTSSLTGHPSAQSLPAPAPSPLPGLKRSSPTCPSRCRTRLPSAPAARASPTRLAPPSSLSNFCVLSSKRH
jgi:hypothetical protein